MSGAVAYLDASAAVKRIVAEQQSAALLSWLLGAERFVSSDILVAELGCFVDRSRHPDLQVQVDRFLDHVELVAFDRGVRERAAASFSPPQRALDAIHLASALHLDLQELVFVSYDERQLAAAASVGLACASPR